MPKQKHRNWKNLTICPITEDQGEREPQQPSLENQCTINAQPITTEKTLKDDEAKMAKQLADYHADQLRRTNLKPTPSTSVINRKRDKIKADQKNDRIRKSLKRQHSPVRRNENKRRKESRATSAGREQRNAADKERMKKTRGTPAGREQHNAAEKERMKNSRGTHAGRKQHNAAEKERKKTSRGTPAGREQHNAAEKNA